MRILVVGAGATGGYFGGRLAQAGRDVTFLVRPGRADQLSRDGLHIASPFGDVVLAPRLLLTGQATDPFDVVILAVKAYALEQALADLAPAVGPATMILPFLNGMRHIDRMVACFGEAPVLGGVCVVATTLDAQGRIRHLNEAHDIAYGEWSGAMTSRIAALDAAFQGAGFAARASAMIVQEMWEKWLMLASAGAATCLLRGTVGEIEAVPDGTALVLAIIQEVASVATAAGFPPRDAMIARARAMLTARASGFAPSLYRDVSVQAPVEVEQILGDLLERAHRFNLHTPYLRAVVAQLRVYQGRKAEAMAG